MHMKGSIVMKKVICIIMAFVITLTCCMAAYAATSTPKISADVERKISETPDGEKFEVLLWLNVDVPTVEELRWLVRQELGEEWWRDHFGPNMTIDDVHTYDAVYNRLAKEYETAANQAFVEKSGIPEEDVVYISTMAPMVQLLANAQTIYRLAEMTEVESISYEAIKRVNKNTILVSDSAFQLKTVKMPLPDGFDNKDIVLELL